MPAAPSNMERPYPNTPNPIAAPEFPHAATPHIGQASQKHRAATREWHPKAVLPVHLSMPAVPLAEHRRLLL